MLSSSRFSTDPSVEAHYSGFRVASVPEPSTFALDVLGVLTLLGISSRGDRLRRSCVVGRRDGLRGRCLDVTIPTVSVGNTGNGNDPNDGDSETDESRVLALSPTTAA